MWSLFFIFYKTNYVNLQECYLKTNLNIFRIDYHLFSYILASVSKAGFYNV